jgi:uncharacterized membrane protein YgcG
MISGAADDRMAFVIETEAKLDAIKAARAEVVGLKADTQGMGVASVAATKNMSAWSAMQAEAAGHLGEHSLAIGRLEMSLARFAERATGVNSTVGILGASMARFAIGSIETAGILIGIDAIIAVYDKLTESARKATDEQNKAIEAFEKMSREKALGPEGVVIDSLNKQIAEAQDKLASPFSQGSVASQQANLDRLTKDLKQAMADRDATLGKSAENTDKTLAGDLATLVAYNVHSEAARQSALTLIRGYQATLANLGDSEVAKRAEVIAQIKALEAPFKAEEGKADAALSRNISQLRGEGTRLTAMVDKALDNADKATAKLTAGEVKGAALHAELEAKALELTLRTNDQETAAKLAASEAEYMRRQVDIANMDVSENTKTKLLADAERLRAAEAANIREVAADKDEKARKVAADKVTRIHEEAEKRSLEIARRGVDAIVNTQGSVLDTLRKIALEPIIARLEGIAAQQAVEALASWPDIPAMAAHGAAAAAAVTAAHEVASWAGSGTHGSSSAGSGGGGGGSTGTGSSVFSPTSGTEGQGSVTINLLTQNPYGYEQIQQVQYNLNRAGILKVPIPISPTKQLMAG